MSLSTEKLVQQIRAEIKQTSLNAVARRLGVNRHSIAAFLIGLARPGTIALILQQTTATVKP